MVQSGGILTNECPWGVVSIWDGLSINDGTLVWTSSWAPTAMMPLVPLVLPRQRDFRRGTLGEKLVPSRRSVSYCLRGLALRFGCARRFPGDS